MKLLLIGGSGAFSQRMAEQACARGDEVAIVARGQRRLIEADLPVQWFQMDRRELPARAAELRAWRPDAVVDSIAFNAAQAAELVVAFPDTPRLVLISSVDVYGGEIGAMPVDETRAPRPASAYAEGKLAAERAFLQAAGARGVVFRPSHMLGRGFLTTSLWGRSPYALDRIRRGLPLPLVDGGRNLVTPVWAADVAAWVLASLTAPAADGQVFNAVGPTPITLRHYFEIVAARVAQPLQVLHVPAQALPAPTPFCWHRPYSHAKATRLLGHTPQGTPETMLAETVQHMLAAGLVQACEGEPRDAPLVALLQAQQHRLGTQLSPAG